MSSPFETVQHPSELRIADSALEETLRDVLEHEPALDARQVYVSVRDGVARLDGWTVTERERVLAEALVLHIPGVRDVENRLLVQVRENEDAPLLPAVPRWRAWLPDLFRRRARTR